MGGDRPAQPRIGGTEHYPHSTRSKLRFNSVRAEPRSFGQVHVCFGSQCITGRLWDN